MALVTKKPEGRICAFVFDISTVLAVFLSEKVSAVNYYDYAFRFHTGRLLTWQIPSLLQTSLLPSPPKARKQQLAEMALIMERGDNISAANLSSQRA